MLVQFVQCTEMLFKNLLFQAGFFFKQAAGRCTASCALWGKGWLLSMLRQLGAKGWLLSQLIVLAVLHPRMIKQIIMYGIESCAKQQI